MDDIKQEMPNDGPILNTHKIHYWQPLKKIFGIHVEKSMVFNTLQK